MPDIHKMLEGLDKVYWVKSSMLLIRRVVADQEVPEIPKNPEIPKMLQSPTNDHVLRLSMLLLRKFLKFQKFKKLPSNIFLTDLSGTSQRMLQKVPKIPKNPHLLRSNAYGQIFAKIHKMLEIPNHFM